MRVLLTLYSTSLGGAEESILQLAEGLAKRKEQVFVLWVSSCPINLPLPQGVRIWKLRMPLRIYGILSGLIVSLICLAYKIQLVNLNWRFVDAESRFLRGLGIKSVATVRAILLDRSDISEYRYTDAIIGISQAVIDRVKELGYRKKCYLVYNGIETNKLDFFSNKLDFFSKIKIKRYSLLSMSRLVGWKRVDWSIRAVSRLRNEGIPVELDIYGDGPEEDNLKKLISDLSADSFIKMKGRVDKNDRVLGEYGIYLIPSYAEPFGKTIIENVIRGKVIVGTNYGGIPELLKDYDLLFERDSLDDYIEKIKEALNNYQKYSRQIHTMSEHFLRYFDMDRVAEDYRQIYRSVLESE